MELSLDYVCRAVKGTQFFGKSDAVVRGVSTDSRNIQPGQVFIALIGEKYDAHEFVDQALKRGATGAVVSKNNMEYHPNENQGLILVEDTLKALQDLAASYRRQFPVPVIAVTGSVGKTTTKDIISACLGTRFKVLKTEGNFNNENSV